MCRNRAIYGKQKPRIFRGFRSFMLERYLEADQILDRAFSI